MKKALALLLTLSLATGTVCFGVSAAQEFFCDTNGDGVTDNLDSALILKYDAGLTDTAEGGDANGDGIVDNLDASMVLKYDAGLDPYAVLCGFESLYVGGIPEKCFDRDNFGLKSADPIVIRSTDELRDLWGDIDTVSDNNTSYPYTQVNLYEKYDSAFFEKNVLIVILHGGNSSSIKHRIDHVIKEADGLTVAVETLYSYWQNDDIVFNTHLIAIDRKYDVPAEKIQRKTLFTTEYEFLASRPRFTPSTDGSVLTSPELHLIKSEAEYEAYMASAKYDFDASLPGLDSFNTAYKEDWYKGFFDYGVLAVIVTPAKSAQVRYRVDATYNVVKNAESLDINVESFEVNQGPDTVGSWHIFIELSKGMFEDTRLEEILNFSFEEITYCE